MFEQIQKCFAFRITTTKTLKVCFSHYRLILKITIWFIFDWWISSTPLVEHMIIHATGPDHVREWIGYGFRCMLWTKIKTWRSMTRTNRSLVDAHCWCCAIVWARRYSFFFFFSVSSIESDLCFLSDEVFANAILELDLPSIPTRFFI